MSDPKKIEIFVCGVQKAGTTSLYAHLREHPELSPPLRKEIHFFDDETVNWSRPDYTALDKWFDARDGRRLRFPREVIETALAHVIGDKAEQAYRRGDALEKRRKLMDAWGGYCEPKTTGNVIGLATANSRHR